MNAPYSSLCQIGRYYAVSLPCDGHDRANGDADKYGSDLAQCRDAADWTG